MSICYFNFDLDPVCKTCSWNLLEVSKNDLKNCVLEIAALPQSQGKVGSALLRQSTTLLILCACTLPDLRPSVCWIVFAFFSPLSFTVGEFHQSAQPIRLDTVSWYR